MEKFDSHFFLRCTQQDRDALDSLSRRLAVSRSNIARHAFRYGLRIVAAKGITLPD